MDTPNTMTEWDREATVKQVLPIVIAYPVVMFCTKMPRTGARDNGMSAVRSAASYKKATAT